MHDQSPPVWPEYDRPLHPGLQWTPINRDAPIAYVKLVKHRYGFEWKVLRCPYCGEEHRHGGGESGDDPREFLGGRISHCGIDARREFSFERDEYRLVEWSGEPLPSRSEIRRRLLFQYRATRRAQTGGNGKREPIARELRAEVWAKSKGHCWYCGDLTNPFENFHVDHVLPVIDGGTNEIDNLVPCCQTCNSRKRDRPVTALRSYMPDGSFWAEREGLA